jgi:plasmid stabilization system protein ParE
MKYRVAFAAQAERDLELIFHFLMRSYLDFGEDRAEVGARAAKRVDEIVRAGMALGAAPHRGALHNAIRPGLRSVTKDRAIYYFEVDDDQKLLLVLAIFFGGQDHQRAMLKRLRGG